MRHYRQYVIAAGVVLGIGFASPPAQAEDYGPFNLQSGKVISNSDRGATAHRDQCYSATSDRFFEEDSWEVAIISSGGKNTRCSVTSIERKAISLTNGSRPVTVMVPAKFCVAAHAETGSGVTNIGKTAWIECNVSAQLVKYE